MRRNEVILSLVCFLTTWLGAASQKMVFLLPSVTILIFWVFEMLSKRDFLILGRIGAFLITNFLVFREGLVYAIIGMPFNKVWVLISMVIW